jgi:hypothetical protein
MSVSYKMGIYNFVSLKPKQNFKYYLIVISVPVLFDLLCFFSVLKQAN